MKITIYVLISFLILGFAACEKAEPVSIENLCNLPSQYQDRLISVQARVGHVCGVDHKKMKLVSKTGHQVKVVQADGDSIPASINGQMVIVKGYPHETKIPRSSINTYGRETTLLCHVDFAPCKDSAWVDQKQKTGADTVISARTTKQLQNRMAEKNTDYVSVITLIATDISIIQE